MFIGRQNELKLLNQLYESNSFECLILYGRRRIGKTFLLDEFAKKTNSLYFQAQESTDQYNLSLFSQKVLSKFPGPSYLKEFSNWHDCFQYLYENLQKEPCVLMIDEFPYLAYQNSSTLSLWQEFIDHSLRKTKTLLILCGSSISFMESEVLGYQSPLFGRRTAQLKLEELTFFDAQPFYSNFCYEDQIKLYCTLGGTPYYLSMIKSDESADDNIKRLFFSNYGYMYNEMGMLLKQELREPAVYNRVIQAIACGKTKMNEICDYVNESSSKVSKYLSNLIQLQIIEKHLPFGESEGKSRKGVYQLYDLGFRFYYRFVFQKQASINTGLGDNVYDQDVKPFLSDYLGYGFEKICIQYLVKENLKGNLPIQFARIGNWWGNNPKEKKEEEIDIMADDNMNLIIGECKYKNEKVEFSILQQQIERSKLFPKYKNYHYFIFSKSGFDFDVHTVDKAFHCITLEELCK